MYLESFQQALHLVMDGNQKFNHKWKKKSSHWQLKKCFKCQTIGD
jgi:hypothetical protein